MRALAVVGVGALVATMGACVALSGIADYAACGDTCGDGDSGPVAEDASTRDVRMPKVDATMTPEVRPPNEDTSNPEVSEAGMDGGPSEAAPLDSGPEVLPPPIDAAPDVGPRDAGLGAHCGDAGTTTRCTSGQVCCVNLATERNACASSCASTATIGCSIPSDCPAGTTCCATMQLMQGATGLLPPCGVTSFSTACAATCAETLPANCASPGVVRICVHDPDCVSDASANNKCFNFSGAPTSWCENATAGLMGGGIEQP